MDDLTQLFRITAREIFGELLSKHGFDDPVECPEGLLFAKEQLEIHVHCRSGQTFVTGILVILNNADYMMFDLEMIADRNGRNLKDWSLPAWVDSPSIMKPMLGRWKQAFVDLCMPIIEGDYSFFYAPVPASVIRKERRQMEITKLYWEAYGAWLEKDFPKLIKLYSELQRLGYKLNRIQSSRLITARAAVN